MGHLRILVAIIVLTLPTSTISLADNSQMGQLTSHAQRLGYALGLDIGTSLRRMNPDINFNSLLKGISDSYKQHKHLLTPMEARRLKQELAQSRHAKQQERVRKLSEKNITEGLAFLAKNKREKNIFTTSSGLEYKILNKGKGIKPKPNDIVTIQDRGILIDGTEFHSSYENGRPDTAVVKSFIPGLSEALQLMREGSRYKIFIPARLAYDYKGSGNKIGPFSVLIYDVKLLKVKQVHNNNHRIHQLTTQPYNQRAELRKIEFIKDKINLNDINLTTLNKAALTVYSAYTNKLTPGTNPKMIKQTCEKISTPSYIPECKSFFQRRLIYIKDFVRADFVRVKRKIDTTHNRASINWLEIFQNKNKKSIKHKNSITIQFSKMGNYWKISNISKKI